MSTQIDPWGRTILDIAALPEILYNGMKIDDVFVAESPEATRFNDLCRVWDKQRYTLRLPDTPSHSPEEEHATRASQWLVGEELAGVNVRDFLIGLCISDAERTRVHMEMDLYEERGLEPLLRTMIYLVDHFRQRRIVWGVGRGSSVASYVLYLIGAHKIDSIKHNLSITEFLK